MAVRESRDGLEGPDVLRAGAAELNTPGWTRRQYLEKPRRETRLAGRQRQPQRRRRRRHRRDGRGASAAREHSPAGNIRASIDKFNRRRRPGPHTRLEPNAAELVTDMDGDAGRKRPGAPGPAARRSRRWRLRWRSSRSPAVAWGNVDVDAFREPLSSAMTRGNAYRPNSSRTDHRPSSPASTRNDPRLPSLRKRRRDRRVRSRVRRRAPRTLPVDDATAQRIESLRNDAAAHFAPANSSGAGTRRRSSKAARLKQLGAGVAGGLEQRKTARLAKSRSARVRSNSPHGPRSSRGSAVLATLW